MLKLFKFTLILLTILCSTPIKASNSFSDDEVGDVAISCEDYKGWSVHQFDKIIYWDRDPSECEERREEKKDWLFEMSQNDRLADTYVRPVQNIGILLTEKTKRYFFDLVGKVPFDDTMIALEYNFRQPEFEDDDYESLPISFYLVKKKTGFYDPKKNFFVG